MKWFIIRWQKLDWGLFLVSIILLILSISVLYSLSLNTEGAGFLVFKKQILFAISGLVLFFLVANVNYRFWLTYSKLIFILFILILLAVLWLGVEIKGITGWLSIGPFTLQPVEFAKISLIIMLAKYFSDHAQDFKYWKHIIISGLLTLIFVVLVMLQPDLGSALVLLGTWIIMLLFTGIRKKHLAILGGVFAAAMTLSWFFILQGYQKSRILIFLNPSADPQGEGYNVIQSIIAVGSGKLFGRGLALGSQSNLRFLPEPGTDFIFAVISEYLGLFGITLVLGLFGFMFFRLFVIMKRVQDNFGAYLILGILAMLLVQIFINIGMNMGISPITGIPLPLLSAGGSSLWAIMIALGIAQNIKLSNS